jgi:hypothetical protein
MQSFVQISTRIAAIVSRETQHHDVCAKRAQFAVIVSRETQHHNFCAKRAQFPVIVSCETQKRAQFTAIVSRETFFEAYPKKHSPNLAHHCFT